MNEDVNISSKTKRDIMNAMFDELDKEEKKIFKELNSPRKIQDFLEILRANTGPLSMTLMSPRRVLQAGRAHCIEGALVAAAALWYHGEPPLLLDLRATPADLDHVVALFQRHGHWGAISKTNHAVLRYREPIYKTMRELALSYFHEYFLDSGKKTLREYSRPFDLRKHKGWLTAEEDLWDLAIALDDSPHRQILSQAMIRSLRKADPVEIAAGKLTAWPESE